MDALSHADQMRLANLINDNSDDAEIKKKLDQVIELTSSTRDQASVALHDCNYDVEKAVDMILEGDQAIVQNQWKSAGKKKNKNNNPSQTGKNQTVTATSSSSSSKHAGSHNNSTTGNQHNHHHNNNNNHHHGSNSDSRRFNNSSNRGGRQISGNQRPFNQRRQGPTNAGTGNAFRAGQWSDVAGNEDWNEGDRDAKVMETKVFTPSSKNIDGPVASQKGQPSLSDSSGVTNQMNLASKLSETVRDDVSSQQTTLNSATQQDQPSQSSPKQQLAHHHHQHHGNNSDNRRFNSSSNRGGRQISGNHRPFNNQRRQGPMNIGVGNAFRAGQWSDVAGNEDWSEEDWDAKVMETKVFTPSSKTVDGPAASQKSQPLLTDASGVTGQMSLASKLSETVRDDVSSQQTTLNSVTQQDQQPQSSPKQQLAHMNDIFEASVAKAVLEQQQANLVSMKPKSSLGMSQYNKDSSDTKPITVLDQSNMTSMKPKTTMSVNQYNRDASETLKSLVGISSAKNNVPSVPPGALPLMGQPQYIVGNAYQPAIFPYAYQTPDVHYQAVAAQTAAATAGRDQTFQSVYSPNEADKFSRGTDGDAPSISTTQAAPVASQTHTNQQAFVANALHAGYQLTYAVPGTFNMMPQNLYSAAPIFSHIPQPTNTGSASNVYPKNTAASYQHHTGYSAYDQTLNPLIQDYVKQPNFPTASSNLQQQPTSKASGVGNDLDAATSGNSYNIYGSINKGQPQSNKQTNYRDPKGYQQQMSNNGPQQFGLSHNTQQPSSITAYPLFQGHDLDGSNMNTQSGGQQQQQQLQQQHSSSQRGGNQVNPSKYYPGWN